MERGAMNCPLCMHPGPMVFVHGHEQCPRCRQNVVPCCNGEQACPPERKPANKGELDVNLDRLGVGRAGE